MQRVILIGFMGCGKSILGKKVAKQLNIPFIDSDTEIERLHNLSVGEIFGKFGESGFREMEADLVKSLGDKDDFVLATGGGMPCFNRNMELLSELGTTYYLDRSAKELANRLKNTKTQRPLLAGFNDNELIEFIEVKLKERNEFYKQSQVILNREDQTPEDIILLYRLLQPHQRS
ncbi:MAG: shikimate kinase [Crocinitomicaceae bacterium]